MHCLRTVGWGAGSTAQSDTPNPSSRRPLRTSFERTATHGVWLTYSSKSGGEPVVSDDTRVSSNGRAWRDGPNALATGPGARVLEPSRTSTLRLRSCSSSDAGV
jgi:hypothetical protein